MPDTKTTGESAATALGGTDLVRGVQSAANVKITLAQIATYVGANLGVAVGTSLALTGVFSTSVNGALSAPGATFTGTWIATGGTATTTKPYILIEPAGATSTAWTTTGTALGINAASGFQGSGNLIDLQINGVQKFAVTGGGNVNLFGALSHQTIAINVGLGLGLQFGNTSGAQWSSNGAAAGTADTTLTRNAAGILQVGTGTTANALGSVESSNFILKRGANSRCGTFVCNGVTPVTVSNSSIAITDGIIISLNTVAGTVGALPAIQTITASSGFTIAGTALDISTYNYNIVTNVA